MVEEKAIVVNSNVQYAWIRPLESSSCSSCTSASSCSTSFLKSILKKKSHTTIRIDNIENVSIGDNIIVGIHPVNLLWGAMLAYLLPVICLIVFALIGQALLGESASISLGVLGLFFGLLVANKVATKAAFYEKMQPVIMSKINEKVIEFHQEVNLLKV